MYVLLPPLGSMNNSVKPQNETAMSHVPSGESDAQSSLRLENHRFSYKELEAITNNFQRVLGQGGFGSVYDGFLEDGTQVAVKLWSKSSNQGVKEFLAEVCSLFICEVHQETLHEKLVRHEYVITCSGSDPNPDSPQESGVHDRLL
jgi:hypothetical protein